MQKPKMFNRIICFVIAMLMLMPGMPGSVAKGAEEDPAKDIILKKEVAPVIVKDDEENVIKDTYEIKLTVKGKKIETKKDYDIVLVLDNSYSMHDSKYSGKTLAQITRDAANNFINAVLPASGESANIRVAVVYYGTDAYAYNFTTGKWKGYDNTGLSEAFYTKIRSKASTSVNEGTTRSGTEYTNTEGGFLMAQELAKVTADKRPTAENIVIFMTDGLPTYRYEGTKATSDGTAANTSAREFNEAVEAAGNLKTQIITGDKNGKIYTVGVLSAFKNTDNQYYLARKLLSDTNPMTYRDSSINNILSDAKTDSKWNKVTPAYADGYFEITGSDPSTQMQAIYNKLGSDINSLATGTVVDVIPKYFKLITDLGAAAVENPDGTTTITKGGVDAGEIQSEIKFTVRAEDGYYGTAYTNVGVKDKDGNVYGAVFDYKLNTTGASGSKYFVERPVVALSPIAKNDPPAEGDYYTTNMDTPLTVAAKGILENDEKDKEKIYKLAEGGYTVTDLMVHTVIGSEEEAVGDSTTEVNIYKKGSTTTAGTVKINADGSFEFNPVKGFTGLAEFEYKNYINVSKDGENKNYLSNLATVTINVVPLYTVTYDGNGNTGGSVPVDSNKYKAGAEVTVLNGGELVKAGYVFMGWNTAEGGSGSTYAADETFKMPAYDVTLYAQWQQSTAVTINYESSDVAMGTVRPENEPLNPETGKAVGSKATPNPGYEFVKWTVKGTETETVAGTNTVLSGAEVDAKAKVDGVYVPTTFVASFKEKSNILIKYEATEGGSVSLPSESLPPATGVAKGSTATAEEGYYFVNWTKDGEVVSNNKLFVPQKVDGLNVAATYVANFKAIPSVEGSDYYVVYWNYDNVTRYRLPDEGEATAEEVKAALNSKDITIPNLVDLNYDAGYEYDGSRTTVETIENPVTTGAGITGSAITFTKIIKLYYDKIVIADLDIADYNGVYDAESHTITVKNLLDDDSVVYRLDGEWSKELSEFVDVGTYKVYVKATNEVYGDREGIGYVTITPKPITIKANSGSFVYNGSERTVTGYQNPEGLFEGHELTNISAMGKGTSVGTYPVTFTGEPMIIWAKEVDVTTNYKITLVPGILTITSGGGGGNPGGGGGNPPTTIEDPQVPLAELEKSDHFAYIIGYPEGDVRPLNNITREEVAMIFYRLLTDDSRNQLLSDTNPFTDIEGSRWSNRAISTLYSAGIIKGYPDGTFRPSDPISRAEFATIAAKFDKLELNNASKFTDIFGHWAEKYITSSENKGWIKGYPDMTFKPEQDITRAEAMTLINNVLDRAVPEENIHPDAMFWPDMKTSDWFFEAVMEATNSHDYMFEEDGDELWTGLKANKVWP